MRKGILIGAIVAVLGLLYFSGRLDYALYNVGLNFHTCARNGFGATFCGSDLTAYQARFRGIQQQVQQTQQSITSSASAAQQSIAQQLCQADPQSSFCSSP